MQVARSRLGWLLVTTYVVAFDILALPYIVVVGRLLLQSPTFALHAHQPWGLVPAVLFCSAIVLLLGAAIEHGVRRIVGK